jgi:hypothetical protein
VVSLSSEPSHLTNLLRSCYIYILYLYIYTVYVKYKNHPFASPSFVRAFGIFCTSGEVGSGCGVSDD